MKLILLGAPGAGKGTQAEILCKELEIPAISTGNILRAAIKDGTPTGVLAKRLIDAGQLVPDEVIIGILDERLAQDDCAKGYILDGVPRTIAQAEAMEKNGMQFDAAIALEISEEEILSRMSGRRVCEACGATYNVMSVPSRVEGVCDKCGGRLVRRRDDEVETVHKRLEIYHNETEPLIGFYAERGLLKAVKVECTPEATFKNIMVALGIEK